MKLKNFIIVQKRIRYRQRFSFKLIDYFENSKLNSVSFEDLYEYLRAKYKLVF